MSEDDITLIQGLTLPNGRLSRSSRLYYYQGNFYAPLQLHGGENHRVLRATREFVKANAERIRRDRAHPSYRTKLQLALEQGLLRK